MKIVKASIVYLLMKGRHLSLFMTGPLGALIALYISCLIGGFDDHDIKMFLAVKFCYKTVQ